MFMRTISEFTLIIDPEIVAFFIIKYSRRSVLRFNQKIIDIQNLLFKNPDIFEEVYSMSLERFLEIKSQHFSNNTKYKSYLHILDNEIVFKEILNDIEKSIYPLTLELEKHCSTIKNILKTLMKIDLDLLTDVYFVPFSLGVSFELDGSIFYGTVYRFPDIINIYHEYLHLYFGNTELEHVIIEFLTSGEILNRLYGISDKSIYMDGHWQLSDLKHEIIDYWLQYCNKSEEKNIMQFIVDIKEILDSKDYFYKNNTYDSKKYLNFSEKIIFTTGIENAVIVNDKTKEKIHVDKQLKNALINY